MVFILIFFVSHLSSHLSYVKYIKKIKWKVSTEYKKLGFFVKKRQFFTKDSSKGF